MIATIARLKITLNDQPRIGDARLGIAEALDLNGVFPAVAEVVDVSQRLCSDVLDHVGETRLAGVERTDGACGHPPCRGAVRHEARGRCPPEDVGGPWGYGELLEAIADPKHERHAEFKQWIAEDFDPHVVDAKWLAGEVAALAGKWSRKPASKRPRRP